MTKTLSNSATAIDFNKEVAAAMNASNTIEGKELRLAVSIYNNPASFDVPNIFGAADKKRGKRMDDALAANSEHFKTVLATATAAKETFKKLRGARAMEALGARDDAAKAVAAARGLFERALSIAYMFRICGATIGNVTGKYVVFTPTKSVEGKDFTFTAGAKEEFTRKQAHAAGRACLKWRGMIAAKSTAVKSNATVNTQAGTSAASVAGELSKVIKTLSDDAADEFSASETSDALLVAVIRRKFVADGKLIVAELVEALRKSDGMKGVSIDTGEKPVERKPRKPVTVPKATAA